MLRQSYAIFQKHDVETLTFILSLQKPGRVEKCLRVLYFEGEDIYIGTLFEWMTKIRINRYSKVPISSD